MLSRSYDHSKSDMLVFKLVGVETADWCPVSNRDLQNSSEFKSETMIHPATNCVNAYTRLLKMAMCLNPRTTLKIFNSSSDAGFVLGINIDTNLKRVVELLQVATYQPARPTHRRRQEVVRRVSLNLLLLGKVKAAIFWWRLGVFKKNRKIAADHSAGNLPKSCPLAFQTSVSSLLQQGEDDAAAAILDLLSEIAHLRSFSSSEKAIRECMLTEARVHLLRKGFNYAMHTLQALLVRHKGTDDALAMESVCLLNHAREALIVWDGYEQHYARLSNVLSALFHSDAPYACQCIAPFSALSSPLTPADMRNVAASAARREVARLPDAPSIAGGHWYHASAADVLAGSPGAQGAGPQRLRVGYVTSEFGDNSVGREISAVAGAHSKERVAVACFFLSPPDGPSTRAAGKRDPAEEWRRRMARYEGGTRVEARAVESRRQIRQTQRRCTHA
jgi:hypothetical protein